MALSIGLISQPEHPRVNEYARDGAAEESGTVFLIEVFVRGGGAM